MTLKSLYTYLKERLKTVSDCADFEATVIIEHLYGLSHNSIFLKGDTAVDESVAEKLLNKRLSNYPLQYLIGEWEFMGNRFKVDESTLIPRPETELLCECIEPFVDNPECPVIYDLCSGSGCVAISVAKMYPHSSVYAAEKYEDTFSVLCENVKLNETSNVTPVLMDITDSDLSLHECDIILSNPPYIDEHGMQSLQKEVLCEPHTALFGGKDGLLFYRAIRDNCVKFLKKGGICAFECGEKQASVLIDVFSSLEHIKTIKDYSGIDRIVIFRKV